MFHRHRAFLFILIFIAFGPTLRVDSIVFAQTTSPKEEVVSSKTGLVVSSYPDASKVGADILRQGGNAVDAAVATAFALAVTWPSAGNIGGGGFMIVRRPNGESVAIDYREKAPLGSTQTMYLDKNGEIDRSLTAAGYLAPGVPGTVRGLETAHRKFGKLPWKTVVMPSVLLAENGFVLSASLARSINNQISGPMAEFPASVAAYGKPGGGEWAAGDRIVLKDLGKTLRDIATTGPDAFYKGRIADLIAADMRANGGLITKKDLAEYQAKIRTPIKGQFRGYEIVSMPPPSSGGTALVEMLNILENFDLRKEGRYSPVTIHLIVESMRRAFLDRARHLGDPDFNKLPIERLISKSYAKSLADGIDLQKASDSVALGGDIVTKQEPEESSETTHFSVIDKDGMAVSNTYTLEGGYGSHVVVKGAGFILNNEMGDFNKKPGETNTRGDIGTPANLIAPGKRMLSSMTPTIVSKDGKLVLITGTPGGRTIINTVLCIVLNVTEFGMDGREAVDAPRIHNQWLPDRTYLEPGGINESVFDRLRSMGHNIPGGNHSQGDGNSIFIDLQGTATGINDKRNSNSTAAK
ncbi:MAG: gamma-glutamyltransferase [Pyrinomonadaceae bacterium]